MGSGASFDAGLGLDSEGERYFCHSCHRVFGLGGVSNPHDYYCPHCSSTFLEQIGSNRTSNSLLQQRHRTNDTLTIEQTRRITNATAMLRLLESQLREELEHLQHAFDIANSRVNNDNNKQKLTKIMKNRIRNVTLNVDMICSQPSCPICSEDYILGSEVIKLPCSHLYHSDCCMPWLEMKQNCPICRQELLNTVPTVEELEKDEYTIEELKERLKDLDVEVMENDLVNNSRSGLASLLVQSLVQHQKDEANRLVQNSTTSNARNSNNDNDNDSISDNYRPTYRIAHIGHMGMDSYLFRSDGNENTMIGRPSPFFGLHQRHRDTTNNSRESPSDVRAARVIAAVTGDRNDHENREPTLGDVLRQGYFPRRSYNNGNNQLVVAVGTPQLGMQARVTELNNDSDNDDDNNDNDSRTGVTNNTTTSTREWNEEQIMREWETALRAERPSQETTSTVRDNTHSTPTMTSGVSERGTSSTSAHNNNTNSIVSSSMSSRIGSHIVTGNTSTNTRSSGSAIDRYMAMSSDQLLGRANYSNTTSASASAVATVNNIVATTNNTTSTPNSTTYQVRATSNGNYDTVAIEQNN